jgi:hypothetical protein
VLFLQVLWPGANWTPVSLSDLMTPAQVKKHHRKAIMWARLLDCFSLPYSIVLASCYCRVVHPDKVSTESVEVQALAQQIFAVLTEAMANLK